MSQPPKPLDAGTGRLVASFDAESAAWLSLGAPHGELGFVELSAAPRFEERERGDPVATRGHRLELTRGEHSFLSVEIDGARPRLSPDVRDTTRPAWRAAGCDAWVEAVSGSPVIRQHWSVQPPATVVLRLRGRIERPALAEITELDPPPASAGETSLIAHGERARFDGPAARAMVEVSGVAAVWRQAEESLVATVAPPPGGGPLRFTLGVGIEPLPDAGAEIGFGSANNGRLLDRALAYVRGCTALTVAPDERAFLTDHRLLPLSWTRDAYWQALLLLATDGPGDRERVADHLRWLWRRCERPDGRWVRSHHANGRRKDLAFQADQQLYPMVELSDYWRLTGSLPTGVDWDREIPRAWAAAIVEVDARTSLMGSAENAADDPATLPFIAASQILLWYAAGRLAELAEATGATSYAATAHAARDAFERQFVAEGEPWPYAVDGLGARAMYHDANDLPTALAPLWGFCDADEPGWRATMAFAFSPENPAWVPGRREGLGSAHTSGAWTLGDIQRWLWARIVGDAEAAGGARARLEAVAFADGMLPEAYGEPGEPPMRHWFAWPGSALGALETLDREGRLGSIAVR